MPYCRRCGTKLEEDAKFCFHCGTPVVAPLPFSEYRQAPAQNEPFRRSPLFIPVIVLVAIVLSAVVIAAVASAPLNPVNFNQSSQISQPGVDRLSLDFQADVAEINVFTNLTDKTVQMDVSAKGTTGIFASNTPVKFTVENSTVNGGVVVTAKVSMTEFLQTSNLRIICNIYVNPALDLTLNVRSTVGQVTMNADSSAKIKTLNLQATTGIMRLDIKKGTIVMGDVSLKTSTGNVWFSMDQANVQDNVTVNLSSSTGSVNMNVSETKKFNGNIQINANTQTGQVNLDRLLIDGEVAAKIESHTTLGRVTLDVNNFSGNQSPIQSDNYPAASNINVSINTNIGNIHIAASYQTMTIPTIRN
jgi:hypothetical protein